MFCISFGPHTLGPALSPHTGACMGTSALMLCDGQACCACVWAVLVVFVSHLHFYVSVWGCLFLLLGSPLGIRYILCVVALLCLLENSSICHLRKLTTHSCLSVALLRKHWCPFPLSISVYLCPWQRGGSGRYYISVLINHPWPSEQAAECSLALLLAPIDCRWD